MTFGPPWLLELRFPAENININLLKTSFLKESFSGNILFYNQEIFCHKKIGLVLGWGRSSGV